MVDIIGDYKKMVLSLLPDNLNAQLAKEKGDLKKGLWYVFLSSVIVVIAATISLVIGMGSTAMQSALRGGESAAVTAISGGVTLGFIAMVIVAIPILMILGSFVMTAIMWALAKVLGGKGSFTDQFYHFAVMRGGAASAGAVLGLAPCVGGLVGLALDVYTMYPSYLVYKTVHKLSSARAAILVLIPIVVLFGLTLLAFALIGSSLAALATAFR